MDTVLQLLTFCCQIVGFLLKMRMSMNVCTMPELRSFKCNSTCENHVASSMLMQYFWVVCDCTRHLTFERKVQGLPKITTNQWRPNMHLLWLQSLLFLNFCWILKGFSCLLKIKFGERILTRFTFLKYRKPTLMRNKGRGFLSGTVQAEFRVFCILIFLTDTERYRRSSW